MPDMEKTPQEQATEKAEKKPEGKKEVPAGDSGEANQRKLAELQEFVKTIVDDLKKARAEDNSEAVQELTAELAGVQEQIMAEEENIEKLNAEIDPEEESEIRNAELLESSSRELARKYQKDLDVLVEQRAFTINSADRQWEQAKRFAGGDKAKLNEADAAVQKMKEDSEKKYDERKSALDASFNRDLQKLKTDSEKKDRAK